jgi:hypothetical protein
VRSVLISGAVLLSLVLAVFIGRKLRRFLPEHHLSNETKDTVKLAMGLVGTMSALLLGLLISSAKDAYDAERSQVIQMTAKLSFLNRVLELYGPEAADARTQFHSAVESLISGLWPSQKNLKAQLNPNHAQGNSVYFAIQDLPQKNEIQQKLKVIAENTAADLAQQRALLVAQAESSISGLMLTVVVSWLVIIFVSFSLLAPPNMTASLALFISTLAVSGGIFLILELGEPFDGLLQIPSQQLRNILNELPR